MVKRAFPLLVFSLLPVFSASLKSAPLSDSPLTMDVTVSPTGTGLFSYNFTLTLDNHTGTWSPGQGWGWMIFGDLFIGDIDPNTNPLFGLGQWPASGPGVPDFTMTSAIPGPWAQLSSTGGSHNGPTFAFVLDYWKPLGIGDSLHWSGTSSADLSSILFSSLIGTDGVQLPIFESAHVTQTTPEPSSIATLTFGLLAIALLAKRGFLLSR